MVSIVLVVAGGWAVAWSWSSPPPASVVTSADGVAVWLTPSGDDGLCVRLQESRPCRTFQRAYEVALAGDVVSVGGGVYPANDVGRDAITVFGLPKAGSAPIEFRCADPHLAVTPEATWLTIKAFHVRLVGGCFRLHQLRVGEGYEHGLAAQDVTVEGVHMDGLEIVGADAVTIRNSEIGPNVYCAPQSASFPDAVKCDPAGPRWESFYASTTGDPGALADQPYIHNNAGEVNPTHILLEENHFHDMQTKDATRWHTSCGLVWLSALTPVGPNNIVYRGNTFENCSVHDLIFDYANGVTLENNVFGWSTEPLSNGFGDDHEAPAGQVDVIFKGDSIPSGWQPKDILIRFNSFSHSMTLTGGNTSRSYTNVRVIGNILGNQGGCETLSSLFFYNVTIGSLACGTGGVRLPSLPYVRYGAPIDYHLSGPSKATDLVPASGRQFRVTRDIDRQVRPIGKARDAGADERRSRSRR